MAGLAMGIFADPSDAAPSPDPKPVPKPQPQPAPPPPPPPPASQPQPAPPPPAVEPPPPPAAPSAAEIAAEQRRREAALAAERREAAARRRAAQRRAAAARARSTPIRILPAEGQATRQPVVATPAAADSSAGAAVANVFGVLGSVALQLLLCAAIPAELAPWYWAEEVLASRRQQFAVSGVMCVLAEGVVFALVFLG